MKSPAFDPMALTPAIGTRYPDQFKGRIATREKRALGDPHGLKAFGVNLTTIPPGGWSAQLHWHSREDEFIYIVSGELTLVMGDGEQVLGPGMAAAFPAGVINGHRLENRTDKAATYLEVGNRDAADVVQYPEIDLMNQPTPQGKRFTNRKGEPY
jgi:uncharacterized cupin superfamily protein